MTIELKGWMVVALVNAAIWVLLEVLPSIAKPTGPNDLGAIRVQQSEATLRLIFGLVATAAIWIVYFAA